MNAGLSEAERRESLLRSGEYADKNPDRPAVRGTTGRRAKKKPKKTARFWLTETGRRTDDGDQPPYYDEILQTLRVETWVARMFFFHYWDGPGQGNGGFGIVNEDLTGKPAYFVLRSVLSP